MRFSFTRLETYRRCPFQYKLRYQHHVPGQPRPGTRLALALHAALAAFYRDQGAMPYPDDLLRTFDAQWPAELSERDVRAMEEGRALLVDYFRRQGDVWPQVRFVEEPFRLELGRHVLIGKLDRVDVRPDGTLQIVDYKTARSWSRRLIPSNLTCTSWVWRLRRESSPRGLSSSTCGMGPSTWSRSMIATCAARWTG
jgi:DNA helicase-2/ATP-dependent DNA helicase PcrA